jgi:hypothetical protein
VTRRSSTAVASGSSSPALQGEENDLGPTADDAPGREASAPLLRIGGRRSSRVVTAVSSLPVLKSEESDQGPPSSAAEARNPSGPLPTVKDASSGPLSRVTPSRSSSALSLSRSSSLPKLKKGEEVHTDQGLTEVPRSLDTSKITALTLDNNQLSGKELATLFTSPSLKKLSARHNWIFEVRIKSVIKRAVANILCCRQVHPSIQQAKKLTKLELEGNPLAWPVSAAQAKGIVKVNAQGCVSDRPFLTSSLPRSRLGIGW